MKSAPNAAPNAATILARVQDRHAARPDGFCVMCRWADGSLVISPCPDLVDACELAGILTTDPT